MIQSIKATQEWFKKNKVNVLLCLSKSPDLKIIYKTCGAKKSGRLGTDMLGRMGLSPTTEDPREFHHRGPKRGPPERTQWLLKGV